MNTQSSDVLFIVGWSHKEGALDFLRQDESMTGTAICVITARLSVALHTALNRPEAIVILHPKSAEEHDLIEDFLLKIDQQCKISSHFVVVVSPQAKRFKSGVQSHSVINTFDQDAIRRAITRGITMICSAPDREQAAPQSSPEVPPQTESDVPAKPSLLEYFNIPGFRKASPVLSNLSKDDRERMAIVLNQLGSFVSTSADPVTRCIQFLKARYQIGALVFSASDLQRFGTLPPAGTGVLPREHKLYLYLMLPEQLSVEYSWVNELGCCILTWPIEAPNEHGPFARGLIYTVMRVRKVAA